MVLMVSQSWSSVSFPGKRGRPVTISANKHPRAQTSEEMIEVTSKGTSFPDFVKIHLF